MPHLIVRKKDNSQIVFKIDKTISTIGRTEDNDICIPDETISRRHAIIEKKDNKYILKDCNSTNGTFLAEKEIHEVEIYNNAQIKFGNVYSTFKEKDPEEELVIFDEHERPAFNAIIKHFDTSAQLSPHKEIKVSNQDEIHHQSEKRLALLLEASKMLNTIMELDKMLNLIMDLLFKIMVIDRASIILLNEETGELVPKVACKKGEKLTDMNKIKISKTIIDNVFNNGVAILTQDALSDARFQMGESIIAQNIRSAMCVPLQTKGKIIGIIYVDNLALTNCFGEDDMKFLTTFANHSAVAIENSKLYKKIQNEEKIRSNLERYFSPDIVNRIVKDSKGVELGGTKKEVTILFSDIRNFTNLSEKMDPDDIVEILNGFFSCMTDIIFEYEGTLDKFIGDGLMAVWGSPIAHNDDPLRAVKSAITMQNELKNLNKVLMRAFNKCLSIGIGINTGEVLAGNIGSSKRLEYTVIGDAVNTASRICSTATSGQILITDQTYKLVKDEIDVIPLQPIKVKGKETYLQVYEVKY